MNNNLFKNNNTFSTGNKVSIAHIIGSQRNFFNSGMTKNISFRIRMLKRLKTVIRLNEDAICNALYKDLGKSKAESYMTEIGMVYEEINTALVNIKKWSRPERVAGNLSVFPSANYIYSEPYGVVLILAPWNYPFNLAISPLVGAIAAGNCVVLKCSKSSINTSNVIKNIIDKTFKKSYVFCADANINYDAIVNHSYDYIFFTGSPRVGRIIMRKAAKKLIPVSLELGGKSPCIVDETADIKLAAKRIVWGKFLNAGQTCISVDYVLVHQNVKAALIKELLKEISRKYSNAEKSKSYPKIINEHHYKRLKDLMKTETTILGGKYNDNLLKIAPTILPCSDYDKPVMEDEIFGPLLPVIAYSDTHKMISKLKTCEKPLACYIFTSDKTFADNIINEISFGGGCVNDVILHIANNHLPFGGVGNSGIGNYHGKYSFDTFSHKKGIVNSFSRIDIPLRYAPYNNIKYTILKKLLH